MPAASTAPPSAPSKPAPVAAPSIRPGSAPTEPNGASEHEPTHESYLAEDMGELEEMSAAGTEPKRETPPQDAKGKFVKQPPKAPEQPQDKPDDTKAPETPETPEKPVEAAKPGTMRALGKAYDELKKEANEVLRPKLQSLESKTKEYERTIEEMRKSTPDTKPLQERLAAIEKENQSLREVVRFTDYRKSPEFTEKYEKPYNEAWAKAVGEVTQLNVQMEDGSVRKATANDLLALANAPLDQLDDLAAQWFPKSSPRVIRHVEKVRELAEAQDKALEEAKKGAGEFATKRDEAAKTQGLAFKTAYEGATGELTKKYAKWFAPDDTDPQGNEILKKGYDYADTVFSANGNLTPEQRAGRLAVIRAKAANHDRLVSKMKAMNQEMVDLQAKLSQFEASEPPTERAGESTGNGVSDWATEDEAELRKLDRR